MNFSPREKRGEARLRPEQLSHLAGKQKASSWFALANRCLKWLKSEHVWLSALSWSSKDTNLKQWKSWKLRPYFYWLWRTLSCMFFSTGNVEDDWTSNIKAKNKAPHFFTFEVLHLRMSLYFYSTTFYGKIFYFWLHSIYLNAEVALRIKILDRKLNSDLLKDYIYITDSCSTVRTQNDRGKVTNDHIETQRVLCLVQFGGPILEGWGTIYLSVPRDQVFS